MKRVLYCFIATFLSYHSTLGQDVHFGVKAGLNAAMLTLDDQGETELKPGLHAGGLAHIHLFQKLALQPELFYSGQGGKRILNSNEYTTNLHYLNLPVLLQYMFNNGFRLQAGPQVGFLLKARQDVNNTESNVIQHYKALDFSFPLGVSYLSGSGLGVDLRWAFGLRNVNDSGNRQPAIRNQVGQVGLFYLFNYGSH